MIAKIVKNLFEIAIASIITFILSLFFSIIGSVVGGVIAYLIIKKANPDEIKGFKEGVLLLSIIAIFSVTLFLVTTSFILKMADTPIGQMLRINDLTGYTKNENAVLLIIGFIMSVINVSAFMLGAYASARVFK